MAKEIRTVDYDVENDIFYISNGNSVKSSLDIGDYVLDVNHKNFVCGIEVLNASENLGISKENLGSIKGINMSVDYGYKKVAVLLMISFREGNKEVNVRIPLSIDLGHKNSEKDVLVYN